MLAKQSADRGHIERDDFTAAYLTVTGNRLITRKNKFFCHIRKWFTALQHTWHAIPFLNLNSNLVPNSLWVWRNAIRAPLFLCLIREYSNIRIRIFELALSNPNHGFGVFVERESKISETNIRFVIHCFRWSDWYELGPSTN